MSPHRLAIVLSHPVQYYSPWFRWIAAHTAVTLRVFYLSDTGLKPAHDEKFSVTFSWDTDLTAGYEHEFVPNTSPRPGVLRPDGLRNPELPARLAAFRPTAILLFGYRYHTHLRLIAWARLRRIPLVFRGDSHLLARPRLPLLKRAALGLLYRQFAAFACVGHANRAYFTALGVPARKLFFAPHAVDAAHFTATNPDHQARAAALRATLRLPPAARIVLFSGKLIPEKQPLALLEAWLRLPPGDHALVIAGDGPQKDALTAFAARHPTAPVRFLPFANQSEMPARYLLASIFVLPSRGAYETWGLAVNEAMHMGVPCLVSDHVGCHPDLVTPGETGWTFPADRPETLTSALSRALADEQENRPLLRASVARRISAYTYEQSTRGLLQALRSLAPE